VDWENLMNDERLISCPVFGVTYYSRSATIILRIPVQLVQ